MLGIGARFSHFVIKARLGVGGMGVVYRAHDDRLGRDVALKVFAMKGDAPPEARYRASQRILREARAAAAFEHPFKVSVFEVGEVDGTAFLSMELVEGRTLRHAVGRTEASLVQKLRWMLDVAEALDAGHAAGIVHRDVKPENVIVRPDQHVKVLDFGIAAIADDPTHEQLRTTQGIVRGTPRYIAPEQLRGRVVDGRADQFSWAVMCFELVCGQPPWDPEGEAITYVSRVLGEEPRKLRDFAPDAPPALEQLLARAMKRDPEARHRNMSEVRAALRRLVATTPDSSTDATRTMKLAADGAVARVAHRKWREMIIAGLALLLACVAWLAWRASIARGARATYPDAGRHPVDVRPVSSNPEAVLAFEEGMQAWRDARAEAMQRAFKRAADLDPHLAQANLRLALNVYAADPGLAGAAFERARAAHDRLDEHDEALLDAAESYASTWHRELAEFEEKLARAAGHFSGDEEILFFWAASLQYQDKNAAARDVLLRLVDAHPDLAVGWWLLGRTYWLTGDASAALREWKHCLELSPRSSLCMTDEVELLMNEGDCVEAEAVLRGVLDFEPDSPVHRRNLADVLFVLERPRESVEAAREAAREREPESDRSVSKTYDALDLHLVDGRFDLALAALDGLKTSNLPPSERLNAAISRVRIATEMGDVAQAGRVADEYLRTAEAWVGTTDVRSGIFDLLVAKLRAGLITEKEYRSARDAWLKSQSNDAGQPPSAYWYTFAWLHWYAFGDESGATARRIIDAPEVELLSRKLALTPREELYLGKLFFDAGRKSDAAVRLRRSIKSCYRLEFPMSAITSSLYLARALESTGDAAGACNAYNEVLRQWGRAKPRSVTADEARERARALGCGGTEINRSSTPPSP
jgi:serine/threonine-protein kinase